MIRIKLCWDFLGFFESLNFKRIEHDKNIICCSDIKCHIVYFARVLLSVCAFRIFLLSQWTFQMNHYFFQKFPGAKWMSCILCCGINSLFRDYFDISCYLVFWKLALKIHFYVLFIQIYVKFSDSLPSQLWLKKLRLLQENRWLIWINRSGTCFSFISRTFTWNIGQSDLTLEILISPISGNSDNGSMKKGTLSIMLISFLIDNLRPHSPE